MSYEVIIKKTGQAYEISDEEGFDLKGKRAEAKRPFLVELEDDQYYSNEIAVIRRKKLTQADIPTFGEQQALPDRTCKAQFSIQAQINKLAVDLGGRESENNPEAAKWSTLIRDKDWRQMMYEMLLGMPDTTWCDDRKGTCACERDYTPDANRLSAVKAMFMASTVPPSSTDLTETRSTGENDGVIAEEPASATIIEEEGKVPVKVNADGSTEMPDDFLAPEPTEPTPEDLF